MNDTIVISAINPKCGNILSFLIFVKKYNKINVEGIPNLYKKVGNPIDWIDPCRKIKVHKIKCSKILIFIGPLLLLVLRVISFQQYSSSESL